jgi:hypothetical protein
VSIGANTAESRLRVAILVVNGFSRKGRRGPEREVDAVRYPWIELCLRQVTRNSQGWDYEVLVYDNSHVELHRELMERFERVRVLPRSWVAAAGRIANRLPGPYAGRLLERRHPSALDHLAKRVSGDVDYIVTLDNDSFPVREDWLDVLVGACEAGAALSGVYRDELVPDIHPFVHVSGLCVGRRDLLTLGASFKDVEMEVGKYKQNADYTQDVGQKITYELLHAGRQIAPLRRSNEVDFHFLMGGIYGDVIYHHGAGGRRASFRTDRDQTGNRRISDALREAAFEDIDHLIAVLRGQVPNDLQLAPLEAHDQA